MTDRRGYPVLMSYAITVVLCAIVAGGMFGLLLVDATLLALLALTGGAIAWGIAARALQTPMLALPAIALAAELLVGFEFKRLYVFDCFGGPPPRSFKVFTDSLFMSDLLIVGLLAGFGAMGWHWQSHRVSVKA